MSEISIVNIVSISNCLLWYDDANATWSVAIKTWPRIQAMPDAPPPKRSFFICICIFYTKLFNIKRSRVGQRHIQTESSPNWLVLTAVAFYIKMSVSQKPSEKHESTTHGNRFASGARPSARRGGRCGSRRRHGRQGPPVGPPRPPGGPDQSAPRRDL